MATTRPTTHQHRSATKTTWGWTACVTDGACDGRAHGGITRVARCRCGAVREAEENGGVARRGGWMKEG